MNVTYENGAFVVRTGVLVLALESVKDIGKLEDAMLSPQELASAKARILALFIPRDAIPCTVFTKAIWDYAERKP